MVELLRFPRIWPPSFVLLLARCRVAASLGSAVLLIALTLACTREPPPPTPTSSALPVDLPPPLPTRGVAAPAPCRFTMGFAGLITSLMLPPLAAASR